MTLTPPAPALTITAMNISTTTNEKSRSGVNPAAVIVSQAAEAVRAQALCRRVTTRAGELNTSNPRRGRRCLPKEYLPKTQKQIAI